ncbi:MAG: HIT domain-containing protein [Candidatus Eremiobacteraeota bacterium]|nr:HIT domain-containing protein [Candidatus Eremiobacteraeota bacterium]
MDDDCIFCKIVAGQIPAQIVHRDDDVVVITDVNPQAPQHLLVMPVQHWPNLPALSESGSQELVAKLFAVASQFGRKRGERGFRLVANTGPAGGQTVDHLHIHVLAGRDMTWPPG